MFIYTHTYTNIKLHIYNYIIHKDIKYTVYTVYLYYCTNCKRKHDSPGPETLNIGGLVFGLGSFLQ